MSRLSSPRSSRRGHTLIEALVASSIVVLALTGLASVISLSGRMEQKARLASDVNVDATLAVAHIVRDMREACSVDLTTANRVRMYYPVVDGNGRYIMNQTNSASYTD